MAQMIDVNLMRKRSRASKDPATWSSAKRRRYGWLVTLSLLMLMMLSWADKAVLGLAAVPIMRDLNITPESFGLVSSAMFLTFGAAQLLAAPLLNRVQSRWILLVLCLMWSVAQMPILVFASLPALWASRLLLGAGEGPLAPVSMHGIYKWFPEKSRATPAAVAASGVTLGIVAFAPVLAWIIAAYSWRTAFAVLAILGVVFAIYWILIGKEGPYTSRAAERRLEDGSEEPSAAAIETDAPAAIEPRIPYRRTILSPSWIFAVATSFFGYWTFTLAMSWGPAYFQTVLGLTSQQAGTLIAAPAAWGTIATVGLSALSQRLHQRGIPTRKSRAWVLGGAAIFGGAALTIAAIVPSTTLTVVLMVFGFGTAPALFSLSFLVVSELSPIAQRGANLSISNAVLTSGGVLAPAVTGVLIGIATTPAAGYLMAFSIAGILLLGCGILSILFINQQRDRVLLGLDPVPAGK